MFHFRTTEKHAVDHLLVINAPLNPVFSVAKSVMYLLPGKGDMLGSSGFKQCKVFRPGSDTSPITQAKTPEFYGAAAAPGSQPHHEGAKNVTFWFDKFQIEIAGALFFFFAQKVVGHFAILAAEGIQTIRTKITIQHKRNKALGGNRFSCAVLATQQKTPLAEEKLFPVIEPEIHESQFVHLPAFLHKCPSSVLFGIHSLP